jgi:dienelactone hydrolase
MFPLALLGALALTTGATAQDFDPAYEQRNFSKTQERARHVVSDPGFQALLREKGAENRAYEERVRAEDPERDFDDNLCANKQDACAGEVRLYDWAANGFGLRRRVHFVSRSGAVISGHVWRTRRGPQRRPGIVITNGSVGAPEELYWPFAAVLAKRGYVVLTFDPQGQGYSDTRGEGPDREEGVPAQAGRPFFDNTEDALDFLVSQPGSTYSPRPSCGTGTVHMPKQERRAAAGLGDRHNPFWQHLDRSRVGIAGHSFGARGVSFVAGKDRRVDAVVGWDNLRSPTADSPHGCASAPRSREPGGFRVPALGLSNDYGLTPAPYTRRPDPLARSEASLAYTRAGRQTAQLNVRGGTHYEYSFIPNAGFGATLRGMDMGVWYTAAWFDKHVRGGRRADSQLLTTRWHEDARSAEIDPSGDPNLFSAYYLSRLDIRLAGGRRVRCEDLRSGDCPRLTADDGWPGRYSYLREANTADVRAAQVVRAPAAGPGCRVSRRVLVPVRSPQGERVVRVDVRAAGRTSVRRGRDVRRVRVDLRHRPAGAARVAVTAHTDRGRSFTVRRTYRLCRLSAVGPRFTG